MCNPCFMTEYRNIMYSCGIITYVRVRVQRADDVLEVCPTILTEDSMQAQHLAATLALYNLVKGQVRAKTDYVTDVLSWSTWLIFFDPQSVHQLLPPTYRDVWLEWRDSEQQQQEESRSAANKPRDQFISRLLTRLKQQQNQNQEQGSGSNDQLRQAGDKEPEESWENLAGLDVVEGGEELEVKSEKRGGRNEGALEASRDLLKKLRKSSLARKLHVRTAPFIIL